MGNRYLSQNSLPHAAVFGGVAQFLQSIMGPPGNGKNGHFPRSPWAVGSTGKILRFDVEIGGWVSLQHPWTRPETGENCNTLQRSGGCPLLGTL